MAEKGWLRKRPLRESSPNLLPLSHSNTAGFRSTTSLSASTKCNDQVSNGKPHLQASSQQKYPRERVSSRIAKSFSWSSFAALPPRQSLRGEQTISSNHSEAASSLKSSTMKHLRHHLSRRNIQQLYTNKLMPCLQRVFFRLGNLCIAIIRIRPTPTQLAIIITLQLIMYVEYRISHQLEWEIDLEWTIWENDVQNAIRQSIPPRLNGTLSKRFSHLDNLKLFPNLQRSNVSDYIVPVPEYKEMAAVRSQLASNLKIEASKTCQLLKQQNSTWQQHYESATQQTNHVLPVMGITVANDTPENRYLRRILHTVDFEAVASIVITWYDEHTEAQLLNGTAGLSHQVIEEALEEFIDRFDFIEIDWKSDEQVGTTSPKVQLASATSLQLMSQVTTSIHQYCLFETGSNPQPFQTDSTCQNELLILRFPTNLGCSTGVNNPLFTHPTSPYWLIANYDIAYPPGVLNNMGLSVQNTLREMKELAVHTFGYIYGRGQLENPWSNFVMTSCAVANCGVWDEDIYPAYYEDDDFRDRIRYIMGKWLDDYGSQEEGYEDAPTKWMDDRHLIRYQTDRSVAVAHGPLSAESYISGTHETMQKVEDEEAYEQVLGIFRIFQWTRDTVSSVTQNPFHYESLRWKTLRELADTEHFFRCKHGNLPDPGEFGEDTLRYFGWNERFLLPFVNETRVDRLRRVLETNISNKVDFLLWSRYSFNATRRKCVHEGANRLLSLPYSEDIVEIEERRNLTMELKRLCSVC